MEPKIIGRETAYAGYLTVERLRIRLASGANVWREAERHGNSVAILPYDGLRRCALLVRLFRAPVFDASGLDAIEEACAGMIDDADENADAAARREASEELGLTVRSLEFVGRVWTSPGVSTERQSLFLAPYGAADRSGPGGGLAREQENIEAAERPLSELSGAADHGEIADGKLLCLVFALRLRHPELFDEARSPIK